MPGPTRNLFAEIDQILASLRGTPSKWTKNYVDQVVSRGRRRISVLQDRIQGITEGRVMPDRDDVTIGSGRRFDLAVLFLDICGFSSRPNWLPDEQKVMLGIMNVFMAEMLSIIHDFEGAYEKNTGDGLMAYFGESANSEADRVKPAVEAAAVMHCVNDQIISPWLQSQNVSPITFRIGIDHGPVTVARVGIRGEKSSRVAIGTTANIACKLMNLIPDGGICIGNNVYRSLPHNWASACRQSDKPTGFVHVVNEAPYIAWVLNHRLSIPTT